MNTDSDMPISIGHSQCYKTGWKLNPSQFHQTLLITKPGSKTTLQILIQKTLTGDIQCLLCSCNFEGRASRISLHPEHRHTSCRPPGVAVTVRQSSCSADVADDRVQSNSAGSALLIRPTITDGRQIDQGRNMKTGVSPPGGALYCLGNTAIKSQNDCLDRETAYAEAVLAECQDVGKRPPSPSAATPARHNVDFGVLQDTRNEDRYF